MSFKTREPSGREVKWTKHSNTNGYLAEFIETKRWYPKSYVEDMLSLYTKDKENDTLVLSKNIDWDLSRVSWSDSEDLQEFISTRQVEL